MARHPVVQELIASTAGVADSDSLIGLFQAFRPGGLPELSSLQALQGGPDFVARMQAVFDAVSASQRSDNMKDAYFVVRSPPHGSTDFLAQEAGRFVSSAIELARMAGVGDCDSKGLPQLRMLEGKPPKHPKTQREKSELLLLLQDHIPGVLCRLFASQLDAPAAQVAVELEEALYFVACDVWLREYLRLPLLGDSPEREAAERAAAGYFELWRHGIKFRVFSNDRVDFYLPRRDDGTLIDAGQFALR